MFKSWDLKSQPAFKKSYNILELITFFTSEPEETKAWTIQKNCTAPKAAGEIHSDFEKGFIRAELDIKKDLWFFSCHFMGDPVMPGCLGLDAMWQLVGFFLGWLGEPGKGRALGVNNVKFSGEVLNKVNKAIYEIDIKRIIKKEGTIVGLANGSLFADNSKIYEAENLKVGLFK